MKFIYKLDHVELEITYENKITVNVSCVKKPYFAFELF